MDVTKWIDEMTMKFEHLLLKIHENNSNQEINELISEVDSKEQYLSQDQLDQVPTLVADQLRFPISDFRVPGISRKTS